MVEDVPKFKSRGEAVLQEYQETENPCRCHKKTNDYVLMAHMIDTHRYFNYYYIYFLNQITAWPLCKLS